MNPLEKYTHLFTNRKFKVRYQINGIENTWLIVGLNFDISGSKYFSLYDGEEFRGGVSLEDCTLVARPISDMTNEEKELYQRQKMYGNLIQTREGFLYLLSIGVYPFDQSHFNDKKVIDITKI